MPPKRKGNRRSEPQNIRLLTIGDSAVGKTCIIMQFYDGTFTNNFITTIGIDYKKKIVSVVNKNKEEGDPDREKKYTLLIWDTAGQERFKTITTSYFRGCQGILLVYDVTVRKSFKNVKTWMEDIHNSGEKDVKMVLIGNKCDLVDKRKVEKEEGEALAKEMGIPFFETSAKSNVNITEAFMKIAEDVVEKLGDVKQKQARQGVDLNRNDTEKKGCC
eukprot:g2588.t1